MPLAHAIHLVLTNCKPRFHSLARSASTGGWLGTGRPSILDRLDDPCFCCLPRAAPESKEPPRLVLVVRLTSSRSLGPLLLLCCPGFQSPALPLDLSYSASAVDCVRWCQVLVLSLPLSLTMPAALTTVAPSAMSAAVKAPGFFDGVKLAPSDPILGVNEAYLADEFPGKISLGVGAYRTDKGLPYVLHVVKRVEQQIVR